MAMLEDALARIRTEHLPFLEEMNSDDPEYQYYTEDIAALKIILMVFTQYAERAPRMLTELPKPVRCSDMSRPLSDP